MCIYMFLLYLHKDLQTFQDVCYFVIFCVYVIYVFVHFFFIFQLFSVVVHDSVIHVKNRALVRLTSYKDQGFR